MTTAELAKALPEIITAQVPGPKSKELFDKRNVIQTQQRLLKNNYVELTEEQVQEIYRAAY